MNLRRYLTIYGALWRTSVTREMSFKGNFLLWILVSCAGSACNWPLSASFFPDQDRRHLDGVAGGAADGHE